MVYLIDDKKSRQENDYSWNSDRLFEYSQILTPIYSISEIDKKLRKGISSENKVILLHESFFENIVNKATNDSIQIQKELDELIKKKHSYIVYFSGSKVSRATSKDGNIAHIPVSTLYQNLEVFLKALESGNIDLRYLLYGENPKVENELLNLLLESNNKFDEDLISTNYKNFIFKMPGRNAIPIKVQNSTEAKLYIDEEFKNQITDNYLDKLVNNELFKNKYDNIFIPLCFGPTLSDFNGLRLASHIRCTPTINQLSNIYIYGFAGIEYFYKNECFNILKTKNVEFIDYSRKSFAKFTNIEKSYFNLKDLPHEAEKLKLDVPSNYEDNHSVANEFGIYQLAYSASFKIDDITDFNTEKLKTLYFKWLITKNGLQEPLPVKEQEKNKNYRKKLSGIKQVGKIDLSKISKK